LIRRGGCKAIDDVRKVEVTEALRIGERSMQAPQLVDAARKTVRRRRTGGVQSSSQVFSEAGRAVFSCAR
jgi:hypothetical protein